MANNKKTAQDIVKPIKKTKKWQKFVDWVNFGNYKNMENSRWLKHKHRNKDRYELDEYDD